MLWEELEEEEQEQERESPIDFDFLSLLSNPKDYYRILEVDYDATEETIRSNYIRLALKWHPDKKKGEESSTSRFQEINEAYKVLSDPAKRREYDRKGVLHVLDYNALDDADDVQDDVEDQQQICEVIAHNKADEFANRIISIDTRA